MAPNTPKYVLVENFITGEIRGKVFTGKLPGERTLARQLGVSYMTVRKAVDNLVADGLLYRVPAKGTFVADGQVRKDLKHTIGYFLDSGIEQGISSPYYSLVFNAIEKEAARHGYSIVYFSETGKTPFREVLQRLDGVIATCFPRIEPIIEVINATLPLVLIENRAADATIPSVVIDDFAAEADAVEYLCSLGHSRIGFIAGLGDSDIGLNRYQGYLHGLSSHDIEPDEALVFRGDYSFEAGIDGAGYLLSLDAPPTAIICASDSMALGAMRRIHESEHSTPRDISVIGFDDIEMAAQVSPALTTMAAPVGEIASRAFEMLGALIDGDGTGDRHVSLAAKLVIRQTCAERTVDTIAA
ncbi:MAG: LacI family DNA-binding transcriptional regulator [Gammaproteobacteria bacterium]